jgi:hypothetical protein
VTERLNDLGKRLVLYGIAALFSLNFIQGSALGAVLAWANLIVMIVAHCFVFLRETGQKYHNVCLLVYYSLLTVWFAASLACYVYNAFTQ